MRYRLRTLLIVLAIGPPALAGAFLNWRLAAALVFMPAYIVVIGYVAYAIVISPWLAIRVAKYLNKITRTER